MVGLQRPGAATLPPTLLSSAQARAEEQRPSLLTGLHHLLHKALTFLPDLSSLLSCSHKWHHEPSIPQLLLSKTKLKALPPSGVLTLSPFYVETLELPLLPLCSFLHPFHNSPSIPSLPSPGWSSPTLPPQGIPVSLPQLTQPRLCQTLPLAGESYSPYLTLLPWTPRNCNDFSLSLTLAPQYDAQNTAGVC